ncbi:MAG: hypothetical protein M1829_000520 [Trizodia sp. TS-e1964]|nr:MAG: hypothetical protein M1829_000520 [Trizodia sp. TS-e1964]
MLSSILYIDAWDSFTNNIVSLLHVLLHADIDVIRIDTEVEDLAKLLQGYDAVVVGPGPGTPIRPEDVGIINRLWTLDDRSLVPILGICLGFQSLALASGARIQRLLEPRHGIVQQISHLGTDIFRGVKTNVKATCYHSLKVNTLHHGPTGTPRFGSSSLWTPSEAVPDILPLAWEVMGAEPVLMALKHMKKPFWGLQYHPESICTDPANNTVILNWWQDALRWNQEKRFAPRTPVEPSTRAQTKEKEKSLLDSLVHSSKEYAKRPVAVEVVDLTKDIRIPELCEIMCADDAEVVVLDSVTSKRYSIIGFVIPGETEKLQISPFDDESTSTNGSSPADRPRSYNTWLMLAEYMEHRQAIGGDSESPFWGGLMGYITYEQGLYDIGIHDASRSTNNKDIKSGGASLEHNICMAFIEKSIVIDHFARKAYIQSLYNADHDPIADQKWMKGALCRVKELASYQNGHSLEYTQSKAEDHQQQEHDLLYHYLQNAEISKPCPKEYNRKIRECQEYIRAGESYELCLTAQAVIRSTCPSSFDSAWLLYKRLRALNPAPFGAFLRLGATTILSSSPEQFVTWDREGNCHLRPIKGTVKKDASTTLATACSILSTPKERAENLMIVDLIRHDLHGVTGPGRVTVPKLMIVEEFETVYQLVSEIKGVFPPPSPAINSTASPRRTHHTGIDVLAVSLPPGSMTGAPKVRTCHLLHEIEERQARGVYSGVLGYMSVCGRGDFSVVIRSAVRLGGETREAPGGKDKTEVWRVGAGGAVTAKSEEVAEWEEMDAKMMSTLRAFGPLVRRGVE